MHGRLCQRESALSPTDRRDDGSQGGCRGTAGLLSACVRWRVLLFLSCPDGSAAAALAGSELEVEPARVDLIGRNARQQLAVTFRWPTDRARRHSALPVRRRAGCDRRSELQRRGLIQRPTGRGSLRVSFGDQRGPDRAPRVAVDAGCGRPVCKPTWSRSSPRPAATWGRATAI